MRTSSLQDLYLQRPITLTILICMLSVLPWIGMCDFATKGESHEAAVAISMLETGNYILPDSNAWELAYRPPMAYWLMTAFSLPQGYVSEFSSRLPSALAFIVMIAFVLSFFGKRVDKFQIAFITTFILITCIEMHRAAMTTHVDMLLASFMVIGLIQLFRWEEIQELKGLPVAIPILLGCAVLTKGPVGLILPLFVFLVYLLILKKYKALTIIKALVYISISSIFLPLLWYIAAWKQGGDNFLNVVFAGDARYPIGAWYNFVSLLAGFVPWTFLAFFSLFGIKLCKPDKSLKQILKDTWTGIRSMEKVRLFSLVALVCIILYYSIFSGRPGIYLIPAYPFIALFLAQYMLYLTEYRTKVIRVFSAFLASITTVVLIAIILTMAGIINLNAITEQYTTNPSVLSAMEAISSRLTSPGILTVGIVLIVFISLGIVYYQMFRKINIKILYATIGLMFCINLLIDAVIVR